MDESNFRLAQYIRESDLEITESEISSVNNSFNSLFPRYTDLINQKDEFNKITNKNTISSDLSSINFTLSLPEELLTKIIEILSTDNDENSKLKPICINIITIYYLLWQQNPRIDDLIILLNLLILLIPTNIDCKQNNESIDKNNVNKAKKDSKLHANMNNKDFYCRYLYEPAIHSIEYCFKFYFSLKKKEIYPDIFKIFSSLFYKAPLNAKNVQNLIPEFLQIVLQMYEIQIDSKTIPDEVLNYIDFLNDIYEKSLFEILPETSKSIIFIMNPYIPLLNRKILRLFVNYSTEITDNMHSSIMSQLSESFFQMVESNPPYVYPTYYQTGDKIEDIISLLNEQPKIIFPFLFADSKLEAKFNFIDSDKTFQDGLNVCHLLDLSEKPETKTIIRDDVHETLELVIRSLHNRGPSQIAIFSSLALKIQNYSAYFFDYCVIFTLFFKNLENDDVFYIYWNTIFDTILFDERVNCFQLNKDFLLFDKLRSLVIDILITMPNQSSSDLAEVVQSFATRPALIDEVVQRISSQLPLIPLNSLGDYKFIQIISSLMLYFQSLNLNCDDKYLLKIIEDTRSSLFYLVLKIFERNKNLYESLLWMSNMFFLPTFISFVFEKPVRPLVLNIIKNYIVTTNVNFYSGVLEKLEELCSLMASRLPQEKETELACDLLQIIIEFQVQRKREKIYYFRYLLKSTINSLDFLTSNTKESMRYLTNVILFLASSLEKLLNKSQLKKISDTILRVENGKPSNTLFPFLTHLLAGKQISTTNPSFLIKQPGVLNLIINCYIHSDSYEQIFMNVKQLLGYSIFNVMSANTENFDCVLIDQINELKGDESNQKKVFLLLDILEYICNISCTKETPMHLISLLYPIQNKWLSPFELTFVRKITDIIIFTSSLPNERIPLGLLNNKDGCYIKVKGFTKSNIPRSFFVAAMIFLDQKSAQNRNHDQIFEIKDSEENGIVSFICSGNLIVKHFNSRITSTAKIDMIPVGVWVPISFFIELPDDSDDAMTTKASSSTNELYKMSLESDEAEKAGHSTRSYSFYNQIQYNCFVTPFIASTKTRRVSFNWERIADGPISITIGNSELNKEEETPAAFLSSILFYDTKNVNDNSIFTSKSIFTSSSSPNSSPTSSPSSRLNSIFKGKKSDDSNETTKSPFLTVSIKKGDNGKISYDLTSTVNVTGELNGTQIDCTTQFCSALRNDDIVSFLLPLFKFIDYPTMGNKILKEFPENLFLLLSATLEAIREKQQVFKDKQGMLILSYLLNNSNAYVPSYSSYMQIYSILTSLIQPLQEDVISLFLLNHKNMVNSTPQNQLRLAKHWNRVLAEDYPNQIKSITPILVLIFEQFISDDLIVKQIRDNLNKVVLKIALIKLSKIDLLSLVSLPLSSPVEYWDTIAIEVMSILSKLIKKENSAIYSLDNESLRYLTLINLYLQTATVETSIVILRKLLKLVLLMHKKNLLKSSFLSLEAHIQMLMREMPSLFAETNVILNIAHLSAEKNEQSLLPLVFFLVSNSDGTALFELFDYLSSSSFGVYQTKDLSGSFTSAESFTSNSGDSFGLPQQQYPNLTLQSKFWLISAAIDAPRDVQDTILKYMMNCPNREDLDTAIIIDIVSKIKDRSSSLLREHMNLIAQSLIDQINESKNEVEIPLSLIDNQSSEKTVSADSSSFNSSLSLSTFADSSSHLLTQALQKTLPARIKGFFQLVSHFLFFKREPLSPAFLHTYEMSIFARLEKEEKKEKGKKQDFRRNKSKNIALNPNRYPQFGSMDLMNINSKGNPAKNTFSDLRSFITSSSKVKKHRFSNFSRSESFHKLLLHPDELYKNSDSSNSTILFDKMMTNSPKELYKAVKKYANSLAVSITNSNSYNNLIMKNKNDDDDSFLSCSRAFGLKFDRNGNMLDHEVAFKCLQLSEECVPIVQSFIPFDLMLSAFLVKKNRIAVEKHLSRLSLSPKQIKANKNTINLLSKYLSTRNKQEQICSWIPNSYDELAVSMAFEEMEPRRSIPIEKREQKILHDYIEEIKQVRKEIKEALSIRRSSNLEQKENVDKSGDNSKNIQFQKPSEYVYFIESEVIELHSQEMITNMMAEKLWKSIENTIESSLFNSA